MHVIQHYGRTTSTRISKLACEHIQIGKRDVGRPKKRRTDQHPRRNNKPGMVYTVLLLLLMIVQLNICSLTAINVPY